MQQISQHDITFNRLV